MASSRFLFGTTSFCSFPDNESDYTKALSLVARTNCVRLFWAGKERKTDFLGLVPSLPALGWLIVFSPKVARLLPDSRTLHLRPASKPPKALCGGISKSIFQRRCQYLAINAHEMAPRTNKRLQERTRDTPT